MFHKHSFIKEGVVHLDAKALLYSSIIWLVPVDILTIYNSVLVELNINVFGRAVGLLKGVWCKCILNVEHNPVGFVPHWFTYII